MERNTTCATDSSVRCPLQPKEVKFDTLCNNAEERFSENAVRLEERRGFRAPPKLHNITTIRSKGRGAENGLDLPPPRVDGAEERNLLSLSRMRPRRATDALTVGIPLPLPPPPPHQAQQRLKTKAGTRKSGIMAPTPMKGARNLWVEGSSVLNPDVGHAAVALSQLTDCVALERRLRDELEAARYAKLQAFRAVVKVFMMSYSDNGNDQRPLGKGFHDKLAVARCSVVTNALVGTVQNYLRSLRSRQVCIALQRAQEPTSALSAPSVGRAKSHYTCSGFSGLSELDVEEDDEIDQSGTYGVEDVLDLEEVNRLKQLYFDYFDCEAVSISSTLPSGGDSCAMNDGFSPPSSRPISAISGSEQSSMSNLASTAL